MSLRISFAVRAQ